MQTKKLILTKYIFKRFFTNVFFISIGFTLLFNLVEFFEKMVRAKHSSTESIVIFILLNLIPSFFENLPIATWLGSCMMIIQMQQQNEWEVLELLNIKKSNIFSLLLISGLVLSIFSFVGKEILTHKISRSAQHFRLEQFKQNRHKNLFNTWFALDKNLFSHFRYLDIEKNRGTDLSLLEMSQDFTLEKITSAKDFSLNKKNKEIIIPDGTVLFTKTSQQKLLKNKSLKLPGFFTQLTMQGQVLSLKQLFHVVIFDKSTLPAHVYHQLLYLFLTRLLLHLLLIFYPLLTFALFFIFPYHRYYRWIMISLPYPIVVISFTATDSFMQLFSNGLLAFFPYALFLAITIGAYFTIRKQ